jgi:dTDP-4-amino-4,6-dideoxygalactose transaminase
MAALLLDIKPGDEVIVPAFTFVSTANAFVLRGAVPRFVDSRPDTLNIDENLLCEMVSENTKAIVPVHYAGVGCEMDAITEFARSHEIQVVEDNAHGLFGKYKGKTLGTFGSMSTLSFHQTKNISCGEGGALVINEEQKVSRAEIIREKGTNRSRFFRGEVDKYSWVDVGSSYLPSDLLASLLDWELKRANAIQEARKVIWCRYDAELSQWRADNGVVGPTVPSHCEQAYHMYYLLMPDLPTRTRFIEHLRAYGILSVFHYLPLNTSTMGRYYGGRTGQCPVAESVSDRIVRLPFYESLSGEDLDYVIEKTIEFRI